MVRVVGGVLANPRRSAHHTIGGKGKIGPAAIFAHPQPAGVSEIVWFFLKFSLDIADNYSILKTYKLINRKDFHYGFYLEPKRTYRNPRHRCGVFSGIVPMAGGLSRSAREGFN